MEDRHVVEIAGTQAVIRDGKVVEIGESSITFCPFAKRFESPINPVSQETVQKNIEHRIYSFGMCTRNREVLAIESMVLFGASELLSTSLRNGALDAVVICCDGAGTVIVTSPELVQGIGGRMSGLIATVPYAEVIAEIENAGGIVIDKEQASLDVLQGVRIAKERGFKKIAVTVAGFQTERAEKIRELYPDTVIIGVHTSGISSKEEAVRLCKAADLVFACASKYIREVVGAFAQIQGGVSIPVFATSKSGKRIIIEQLLETSEPVLVKNMQLPVYDMGKQPEPLI
ncbi:MAG TPA: DUF2099 family protein [Methanocorpusculum sp.]|nr:DUF2099 family protein [Methanocorpusculum sp.]